MRNNSSFTVIDTVQEFCRAWFEQRDAERTAGFLTEDVCFVGTGRDESADGLENMTDYLRRDIAELTEPFACALEVIHDQEVRPEVWSLSARLTLKNSLYTWRLRGFFTLLRESGGDWRIKNLHVAEPGSSQRGQEHYPQTLVLENIARQRQELLNASVLGGMMGGYIEEGFPFYFVNCRMLDYLGYADEAEFVADIGGFISNCMHPDDRKRVDDEVEAQLAVKDEYVVEYRMKKKDGSYIWVHDIGRAITAEDGRPAIESVCLDITSQKEAQDELLHLYNNIPGAVFRCRYDENYTVIHANDHLFEFLGYSREEFAALGNCMAAVTYPEDLPDLTGKLTEQLRHGNILQSENRLVCKNGTVKWISVKGQMLTEKSGERYFYCVFVDITEQKLLRDRARELYDQELAYFIERSAAEDSIQGRINVTRNRVESYLAAEDNTLFRPGATYSEAVEKMAASAVDPACREEICRRLQRDQVLADYAAGRMEYNFDYLRRNRSGGIFWANTGFRSYLNPETRDVIVFFYTKDVSETRVQELLLNKIAALDYDVIVEVDLVRGGHRIVNVKEGDPGAFAAPGQFRQAVLSAAGDCMDEEAQGEFLRRLDFAHIREQLARADSYSFVMETRDREGRARVKRFQVFYISRELERVGVLSADVTDVVRQEQRQKEDLAAALAAAEQANAAKSDFLSRMSHEIRTPMNAIIGMSAIAAQSVGNDELVSDCLSKIGVSSRFLLSLINDILDMSRIESGKVLLKNEKIRMDEFLDGINAICNVQAQDKGVEYECVVDQALDDCYVGDSMKLQQVLINILGNAIKFTKAGGRVGFSAALHKKTKNHAVLRFIVNDTGIGMSESYLPRIFEPFSQESTGATALYGGTGLGLAISKNLVDLMDGRIVVRSIQGSGSEFTVYVKLGLSAEEKPRRPRKNAERKEAPHYDFTGKRILLVEDNAINTEVATMLLESKGFTVDAAENGLRGLELFGRSEPGRYSAILMDIRMPLMDGLSAARNIRHLSNADAGTIPIIAMTANAFDDDIEKSLAAGMNAHLAKPIDPERLYRTLLAFISG